MAKRQPARGATHAKGLGWRHRQQAEALKRQHRDGVDTCWWCGEVMWLAQGLSADHSTPRSVAGPFHPADRLLHRDCNSARGSGENDDQRPALTGKPVKRESVDLGRRLMRWPI
jgi:5-methylcytosine-specific restriction endonuclease McrA